MKTSVDVYINFNDHLWERFSYDVGLVDSDRDLLLEVVILSRVSLSGKSLNI